MFFVQVLDPDLGCAAYVLGDAGAAVAVDPGLDTDRLIAAAAAHGAVITTIAETHVHADHVSGRALLADATGAACRRGPSTAGVDGRRHARYAKLCAGRGAMRILYHHRTQGEEPESIHIRSIVAALREPIY